MAAPSGTVAETRDTGREDTFALTGSSAAVSPLRVPPALADAFSAGTQRLLLPDPMTALAWAAELLNPITVSKPTFVGAVEYEYDPVGWAEEFIDWSGTNGLTDYQKEILSSLAQPQNRWAVRGPHGLGKTVIASIATLWFALTRDGRYDWKVVTTASAWRHLTKYLWPEIHKWCKKLRWDKLGRPPFNKRELLTHELHLQTGQAFAAASDEPENIEGAHADRLMYILDEAKTIPAASWDAIEGAFSGAGEDTKPEAHYLAISTPGEPAGRFFAIHKRLPGFEDWHVRHVTLEEAIAAGRITKKWAEQRIKQYGGPNSILSQNRVFGNFAQDAMEGIIPLSWAEQAMERWTRNIPQIGGEPIPLTRVTVDVARYGEDQTVLCSRHGPWFDELFPIKQYDTMQVSGVTKMILDRWGRRGHALVDVIGIGAGVVDDLKDTGYTVYGFSAAEGTGDLTDLTGQVKFENMRSYAWWTFRQALDPDNHFNVALPPDDELLAELTSARWHVSRRGRIQVEKKDEMRKRLGRSPDKADAVVMQLVEVDTFKEQYVTEPEDTRVVISPF